jgi:hypothetical protein
MVTSQTQLLQSWVISSQPGGSRKISSKPAPIKKNMKNVFLLTQTNPAGHFFHVPPLGVFVPKKLSKQVLDPAQ